MEYYKLLQLQREPFSNSPDPEYFFLSRQHQNCLQKLELALRLKRGLNVVIGDVGTGKTTLCRELIRRFAAEPDIETHLILDPAFNTTTDFLLLLHTMFCDEESAPSMSEMTLKEHIQRALFTKGVDRQRTIVLILDEGQKISSACVEILRELLNFETNNFKLLQIVIFAQLEFDDILRTHPSFADRINLLHHLRPMDFNDTRRMIHHRLKLSSPTPKPQELFTWPALWAIYRSTQGYPRKIIHLCHQSVLTMLIQNRTRAGWLLIRSCKNRMVLKEKRWPRRIVMWGTAGALILLLVTVLPRYLSHDIRSSQGQPFKVPVTTTAGIDPDGSTPPVQSAATIVPPPRETVQEPPIVHSVNSTGSIGAVSGKAAEAVQLPMAAQAELLPAAPAAPPESIPAPAPPSQPPTVIGRLAVRPGDTLIHLVRLVYGTDENRYMRSVIVANPQIKNPNTIDLDDVVAFPAMAFQWDNSLQKAHRIVFEDLETLAAARDKMSTLAQTISAPLSLFCYWTPTEGSRFQLALNKTFDDPHNAQQWLDSLPAAIAEKAGVQSGWPKGVLFFSNPHGEARRGSTKLVRTNGEK
jgi:general secretion pathway protein A